MITDTTGWSGSALGGGRRLARHRLLLDHRLHLDDGVAGGVRGLPERGLELVW